MSESLNAFTNVGAYAAFEENQKGKLKNGYLADFIVLDRDILSLEPKALLETTVLETHIGGERVFSNAELDTDQDACIQLLLSEIIILMKALSGSGDI